PSTGQATITTAGTAFDTVLGVYTGTSVDALAPVLKNDDGGVDTSSLVQFPAVAGTTYMIAVDGYNNRASGGDAGPFALNYSVANCTSSAVQFDAANYSVNENANSLTVSVTRSGSLGGSATVDYATSDNSGLTSCTVANGIASSRCDYASAAG